MSIETWLVTFLLVILGLIILNLVLISIYFSIKLVIFLKVNFNLFRHFSFEKIRKKALKYFDKFKDLRFHDYIDIVNIIIITALLFFGQEFYLLAYLPLYLVTRIFILIVKDILVKSHKNEITEFWFFVYVCLFILLMLAYIATFSFFYSQGYSLNHGYLIGNGRIVTLAGMDSVYYSAFTFFSMEYKGLEPKGLLTFFTITEVFIAQIILITFIGVMAGVLITKVRLKDLEE